MEEILLLGICGPSLFRLFFPPSELQQQQQQLWKHNTKPSESVRWEFLSMAKGNSSTKTKHDFKRWLNILDSWQENHPISSQLIAAESKLLPLHVNFSLPEKSPVWLCNKFIIYCGVQCWVLCDQEGESWGYRNWSPTMCHKQSKFWHYLQRLNTSGNA